MALDWRASLRDLIERTHAALDAAVHADDSTRATAYTRLDRLDQLVHLGVYAWSPTSGNPESVSGVEDEWIEDTVTVVLAVNIVRTPGQIEMLLRVGDHEEILRNAVCFHSTLLPHQPVWTGTTRVISPDKAWVTSSQNFRMRRREAVRS
jgi:hypothetical protein